jgi:Antitoxin Xre/MbcA/ParS C-terminal toxin-binding domain/Antitoxin Xre-like helix-turn-helix domain
MNSNALAQPEARRVLSTALVNAGKELGLTQQSLGEIVGKDRTALSRGGIDPESKSGELALLLVRAYRALFALTGGDRDAMRHWFQTENLHTGGVPSEQVRNVQGLMRVVEYLDAIRGKL